MLAFSGAMVPGPLLTVTIDGSLRQGFRAGPLIAAGHVILEIVILFAMVRGLDRLVVIPGVKESIGLIGGVYLVWMAWRIIRDVKNTVIDFTLTGEAADNWELFMKGILVSLSGPYFIIWWATIGLTYMGLALERGLAGLTVFFLGHALADFGWSCMVSYLVGTGRKRFSLPVYKGVLGLCGGFLFLLGLYFFYSGTVYFLV
jgi:threonine/homoserine/homoserine lactone efflux protein